MSQIQDEAYTEACEKIDSLERERSDLMALLSYEDLLRVRRRAQRAAKMSLVNLLSRILTERKDF